MLRNVMRHQGGNFTAIDNYLRGVRHNKAIIERLVIRYGWVDRRLSNLSFVNLTDFMKNIRQGDSTSTDQLKLQELCKQLSLSMKVVVK